MGRQTPYFLFTKETRAAVLDQLQEDGLPTSVGNVGKALGARWKELTDEQRQEFKDRCEVINREAAEEAANNPQPTPQVQDKAPAPSRAGRQTPYFLFLKETRPVVIAELQEKGEAASIGAVGKIVGARWKELTDEQRQEFKDRCEALNAEAAEAAANQPPGEDQEEGQAQEAAAADSTDEPALPLSKVRRFMQLDPEVKHVSKDALYAVAQATELFLHDLVESAAAQAKSKKRRTVQMVDIEHMRQLAKNAGTEEDQENETLDDNAANVEMLDTEMDDTEPAGAKSKRPAAGGGRPKAKASGVQAALAKGAVGTRHITSFFGGRGKSTAAAESAGAADDQDAGTESAEPEEAVEAVVVEEGVGVDV